MANFSRTWPRNLLCLAVLLLSLAFLPFPQALAAAGQDNARWAKVNIPAEGVAGNWVLAAGSDVELLTMAIDGTLYTYANPSSISYTLFKSTDNGYSWSYTGKVKDAIVDIAIAPDTASVLYYATTSKIYRSTDGGNSFVSLLPNPGGAGSANIEITSIDVGKLGSYYILAVATRDTDAAQFGGVYLLDEKEVIPSWQNTGITGYDVYALAFSPNYASDRQLVAVANNETSTVVTSKIGNHAWGTFLDNATIPLSTVVSAAVAFPSSYDAAGADPALYAGIDTGSNSGDVYLVNQVLGSSSPATDLNAGIDVTSLAVSGSGSDARLLAGAAGSAQVYSSADNGMNWKRSTKPPTGGSKTYLSLAADGKAYAATSGTESALSISIDGGVTWNQTGLIDSGISNILEVAPSPEYSQDNTLFMLTWGSKHSLWRSTDGGTHWERVFGSALANVSTIERVALSPDYATSQVIFVSGTSNGKPATWKSRDNGQSFGSVQLALDPDSDATITINAWTAVGDNALFIGGYNGSNGLVYYSENGGFFYSSGVEAGSQPLKSIALSPGYNTDKTILAGNTNGWVFWSKDGGLSFEPLPRANSAPLSGNVTVAFDPGFSQNHTVYAASDTPGKGIYRFIVSTSTTWESIDSNLPSGSIIESLALSADGVLYGANSKSGAGMERSLNPRYSLGPAFETVNTGLDSNATLSGLRLSGNQLWSIDTTNIKLVRYADTLTQPVTPVSPANGAPGVGELSSSTVSNVSLDWKSLSGATGYKWQLSYENNFTSVPAGFEGNTEATSARLPALEPGTTYHWRVRATSPVLSQWSEKWSFTTCLGLAVSAPQLISPEAGASQLPLRPVFQWSPIAGAGSYELLISESVAFSNPLITRTGDSSLPETAWQSDVALSAGVTYFWKVRARSASSFSAWSPVGAFTTIEAVPSPTPTSAVGTVSEIPTSPTPKPTPDASKPSETPDWANKLIYLGAGLLTVMVALLVTLVIMLVKKSRV